ncbi:MAG: hypothetical protein HQK77_15605 [Desulfobacterales bacterium]|nr:hypothetical protein [Desulfobacterales bacterium]
MKTPGTYSYAIQDATGIVKKLQIKVLNNFSLEVPKVQLKLGEQIAIKPNGGMPPFMWTFTAGQLNTIQTTDLEPVIYTAPNLQHICTITAVDADGVQAQIVLNTYEELHVSPSVLQLSFGDTGEIRVMGGTKPYEIITGSGFYHWQSENLLIYKPPEMLGDTFVKVRDQSGNIQTIQIQVFGELNITPVNVYLHPNEQYQFHVFGGLGTDNELNLFTHSGNVPSHPSAGNILYQAPAYIGSDYLYIIDRSGQKAMANIIVTAEEFFISPLSVTRKMGEEVIFNAIRSAGNVVWWTDAGELIENNNDYAVYQAPTTTGTYRVFAIDQEGKEASATVFVVSNQLHLNAENIDLKPGERFTFRVFQGSGGYQFIITDGLLHDYNPENHSIQYVAPRSPGQYYLMVIDSAGSTTEARIIVSGDSGVDPVFPWHFIYDIRSQLQAAEVYVSESTDAYQLAFSLNYEPEYPVPMDIYLRWTLPNGNQFYVQPWDLISSLWDWGIKMTIQPQPFIEALPISAKMFQQFSIYGGLFAPLSKTILTEMAAPEGSYLFEIIFIPYGVLAEEEYSIPITIQFKK